MKAHRENDGQIKIYRVLPSKFKGVTGNYAGGFHKANKEILEQEGFFDIVEPKYNRLLEVLSDIYLDEENKIYTYDVLPKPDLPTLNEAKINKIKELKLQAREKFSETDWYYIRELHTKKEGKIKKVPVGVVNERENIYNSIDAKENKINTLNDLEEVLIYDTNFEELKDEEKNVEEKIIKEELKDKENFVKKSPEPTSETTPTPEPSAEELVSEEPEPPVEETTPTPEPTSEPTPEPSDEEPTPEPTPTPTTESTPVEESINEEPTPTPTPTLTPKLEPKLETPVKEIPEEPVSSDANQGEKLSAPTPEQIPEPKTSPAPALIEE